MDDNPKQDDGLEHRYGQFYRDPRELAFVRIEQWSEGVSNLQTGNTIASSALLPLAAIIGYRTARSKSAAATASLATGGIIGLTLSDALIQVNRIDAYLRGIGAMECALANYPNDLIPTRFSADDLDPEKIDSTVATYLRRLDDEIFERSYPSTHRIQSEMLLAVSRITGEVNQAIRGSIVSIQDLSRTSLPISSFDFPENVAEQKSSIDAVLDSYDEPNGKIQISGQSVSIDDQSFREIREILLRLRSKLNSLEGLILIEEQVVTAIRSCSVVDGLSALSPDRIAKAPVELSIVPTTSDGEESVPGCTGNQTEFPIEGGVPPYRAELHPASDEIDVSAHGSTVAIQIKSKQEEEDLQLRLNVWDSDNRHSSLKFKVNACNSD